MKLFNDIPLSIHAWLKAIAKVAIKPFILILIGCFIYVAIFLLAIYFPQLFGKNKQLVFEILNPLLKISELVAVFWFLFRVLAVIKYKIQSWGDINSNQIIQIIYPMINNGMQAAVIVLMIHLIIPELNLPGFQEEFLEKLTKVLLISTLGGFSFKWLMVLRN